MEDKKTVEWNPGEKMTKEFALSAIDGIKQFYRRLYYQPKMKPFNTDIDFEASMQVLNGLREMIEASATE